MSSDAFGSVSRRNFLCGATVALGAGFAARASAQQKIARNLVQYQPMPKDDKSCAMCMHFEAPRACRLVDGDIDPKAWCALFALKTG